MNKTTLLFALISTYFLGHAQTPEIDNWIFNQNGTIAVYLDPDVTKPPGSYNVVSTGDSSNILQVCYDNDFVWVRTEGLADTMGILKTPNPPVAQASVRKFPRVPTPQLLLGMKHQLRAK